MRDKIIVFIIVAIVVVSFVTFVEFPSLCCSSSNDVCSIYTKKLFSQKQLVSTFKASDVVSYEIKEHTELRRRNGHSRRVTHYTTVLKMKDGSIIYLKNFETQSYKKAKTIGEKIMHEKDFVFK